MSYQVPQHIDNNKVFIVNRSEIEGRLDPLFYTRQFSIIMNKIKECALYKQLHEIAHFSSESWNQKDYYEEEFPYIEIGAINITDGLIEKVTKIPVDKAPSRAKVLVRTNDIIISTTRPSRGAIVKITGKENLYIASTGFSVIRDVDASVNRDYLYNVLKLNLSLKQMQQRSTGGNYPAITQEELGKILIPLPPIDIQIDFVSQLKVAYIEKHKKDIEAQHLLESIDTYLLNELGVSLPEVRNELKDRVFLLNRSELEGRFNPTVYKDGIKLISPKWDNEKLSKVAFVNPSGAYKGKTVDTPISFVPMEVIDETFSEITTMDETTIELASGFTKFRERDLLWAKITPCMQNGKSAIAKNLINGLGCGSTEFFVLRPKDERLSIEYLHVILHMKCVRETAMLYFGGTAGQQRVPASFLENFNLPLPPKEKQVEIANHVYALRQQAKALREEGKRILESAKQEVERMIIGRKVIDKEVLA